MPVSLTNGDKMDLRGDKLTVVFGRLPSDYSAEGLMLSWGPERQYGRLVPADRSLPRPVRNACPNYDAASKTLTMNLGLLPGNVNRMLIVSRHRTTETNNVPIRDLLKIELKQSGRNAVYDRIALEPGVTILLDVQQESAGGDWIVTASKEHIPMGLEPFRSLLIAGY